MESILCLLHTESDGSLGKLARQALSAALALSKKLGGVSFSVGLVGGDIKASADSIGSCDCAKMFAVSGPDFSQSRYATDALAAETMAKMSGASIIIAPGTSRFSRSLPGLTTRLGGRVDTHVGLMEVQGSEIQVQRWYYRQRMIATVSRTQRPWIILVDSGTYPEFQGESVAAKVESLNVTVVDNLKRTKVEGVKAPSSDAQTIRPDAKLLFVAGAGWTKKQSDGQTHAPEAEKLILGFIEKSKASLGSSKSLVDQSGEGQEVLKFLSHLNQVGQTGATPRHPKGLSACCYGEEPHVVGWRFVNERRAVNIDPNCGWSQGKTDVLYVADAFKVIAKVNELLSS